MFWWVKNPYLLFKGNTMIISKAPAPTDILWENLNFSFWRIYINNTLMFFASIVILFVSFIVQFKIMKYAYPYKKQSFEDSHFDFLVKVRALIASLVVATMNVVLRLMVFGFNRLIKQESMSRMYQTYLNKYTLLYFFNSAFMPYLVHGI